MSGAFLVYWYARVSIETSGYAVDKTEQRTGVASIFLVDSGAFFAFAVVLVVVLRYGDYLAVGIFVEYLTHVLHDFFEYFLVG